MATSTTKIILYEIPGNLPDDKPISPLSATIRAALNYKQLAYRTQLVPMRDFQSLAASIGAKPTGAFPDGTPRYTVPTIVDSTSGTRVVMSETLDILSYLHTTYPDPARPLFSSGGGAVDRLAHEAVMNLLLPVLAPLDPMAQYATVPEGDKETWRKHYLGSKDKEVVGLSKDSEEYRVLLKKGEEAWQKLADLLGEENDWFGGEKPLGLDFFVLAMLVITTEVWRIEWEGSFSKVAGGRLKRYLEKGEVHLKFTPESK